MFESAQNWNLFGYDMRNVGRHWQAGWRDLLWADDSPLRQRLDEAVSLRSEDAVVCYQAGRAIATAATTTCSAILLPEALVLSKTLPMPAAVEAEMEAVLALEVNANSPFAADDTGYGWHIVGRDESQIQVLLVIVSKSSAMTYLGHQYDAHDPHQQEVWAQVGEDMVVVRGFGENLREGRYNKRLLRTALMLAAIALLLLSVAGVAAGAKGVESGRVQAMADNTQKEAAQISSMRSSLVVANETIAAVNQVVMQFPNPHLELARLTHLLGDTASVDRLSVNGLEIDLRGRAQDASSVMKRLNDQPDYAQVTAPRAISRVKGTQQELFYLSILRREGSQQ